MPERRHHPLTMFRREAEIIGCARPARVAQEGRLQATQRLFLVVAVAVGGVGGVGGVVRHSGALLHFYKVAMLHHGRSRLARVRHQATCDRIAVIFRSDVLCTCKWNSRKQKPQFY